MCAGTGKEDHAGNPGSVCLDSLLVAHPSRPGPEWGDPAQGPLPERSGVCTSCGSRAPAGRDRKGSTRYPAIPGPGIAGLPDHPAGVYRTGSPAGRGDESPGEPVLPGSYCSPSRFTTVVPSGRTMIHTLNRSGYPLPPVRFSRGRDPVNPDQRLRRPSCILARISSGIRFPGCAPVRTHGRYGMLRVFRP